MQPLANGALVLSLDTDFDGCMALVQEITKQQTVYLANSMNSLRIEGQKTVAIELVQQFDWEVPDWVVIPGGNLGNVSALGKGFLMMRDLGLIQKLPRIAVAQAENANPLYRSFLTHFESFAPVAAQKTLASAIQIGNPVSYKRAIRVLKAFDGVVEQASENELADEAARADRTGMFNCPHTGVALAALRKLVERKVIRSNQRVVVISTAHGLKFADQKTAYHLGQISGRALDARQPPGGSESRPAARQRRHPPLRGRSSASWRRSVPLDGPLLPRHELGPSSRAVHAGEPRTKDSNAIATPIIQSATYTFANTQEIADHFEGRIEREEYGRYGNPTQRVAELKLAALEGAEDGLLFASGMAAITTTLFAMLVTRRSRHRHRRRYRRTRQFLHQVLRRYGVEVSTVPAGDYDAHGGGGAADDPPHLQRVADQPVQSRPRPRARRRRSAGAIGSRRSSTRPSPPRSISVRSSSASTSSSTRRTKYLGGHNDLLAGVVLGSADLVAAIREFHGIIGAVADPFAAYLLIRGIKTLALRVARQNDNAQRARRVPRRRTRGSTRVHYPGLPSHPEHARGARGRCAASAASCRSRCAATSTPASRVVDGCRIPRIAPSLGGVESLIEQPALMSFYELTTEERLQVGIKDTLVRYSVGIEDADDLIADLAQALEPGMAG